jgi:hypothetical protein
VSAQAFDRWRLTLPLLLPSLGGLVYLTAFEAPTRLIAVNAGALALAVMWVLFGRVPSDKNYRLSLAGFGALALHLPNFLGPEVGGVSRWFPAGPVVLQSGPLLLPLITVLVASAPRGAGAAVLALAGVGLVRQPDAAGLAALGLTSAALAFCTRGIAYAAVSLAALLLAAATFEQGTLEPQIFTENVLPHVAERSALRATALAAMLFVLPLWHLVISPQTQRAEGAALAALLVALGAMALIAPFPYPLIGYGAAPILGFGLALGATAREAGHSARNLPTS